ncbi:hypothetical protein [Falsiroseomonas sp.]|uniref:hypothetical protein n=1 Tax=Falsiroseomonas sp. TaxID=2870721 RepID=UPI0035658AC6
MPSRTPARAQLSLALAPPPPSPVPILPEAAMATLAELLLEAAGRVVVRATEEAGDEQDHR